MGSLGDNCITRNSWLGAFNGTFLKPWQTFSVAGKIISWCVYAHSNANMKLKVFRDDGTNYIFVGGTGDIAVVAGLNTNLPANLDVQVGDFVGIYMHADPGAEIDSSGSNTYYFKSGDITSDSLKSGWSSETHGDWSLKTFDNLDIYVDSSAGSDSNTGDSCTAGRPVQTFAQAYSLLASGGTIHCCASGYDFSGETVTRNKSYSMTVDGDGYWYDAQAG